MMGSVDGKNLRTPLTVDTERCNTLQEKLGISLVSCDIGVSTLRKQRREHFRILFKPIKCFPQIFKIGYTVTFFFFLNSLSIA